MIRKTNRTVCGKVIGHSPLIRTGLRYDQVLLQDDTENEVLKAVGLVTYKISIRAIPLPVLMFAF